ncbi:MAG: hypothetical protein WC532_08585 [Candidatus Omnitrophota bacterium]
MEIIKSIIIAVICSFTALLLHLFLNIFRKGRQASEPVILELGRQAKISLAAWIFTFILFIVLFFFPPAFINALAGVINSFENPAAYIYGVFLYLILCFSYLIVYYFIDRSISATLLEMIENSPEGKLSIQQIKEAYSVSGKYRMELKGMAEGGFIVEESGYFRNSLKGRLYARLALITKAVLKLGPGG